MGPGVTAVGCRRRLRSPTDPRCGRSRSAYGAPPLGIGGGCLPDDVEDSQPELLRVEATYEGAEAPSRWRASSTCPLPDGSWHVSVMRSRRTGDRSTSTLAPPSCRTRQAWRPCSVLVGWPTTSVWHTASARRRPSLDGSSRSAGPRTTSFRTSSRPGPRPRFGAPIADNSPRASGCRSRATQESPR